MGTMEAEAEDALGDFCDEQWTSDDFTRSLLPHGRGTRTPCGRESPGPAGIQQGHSDDRLEGDSHEEMHGVQTLGA